jgi:hypothetical protein
LRNQPPFFVFLYLCFQIRCHKDCRGIPVNGNFVGRIAFHLVYIAFHGRCARREQLQCLGVTGRLKGAAADKTGHGKLDIVRKGKTVVGILKSMLSVTGYIADIQGVSAKEIVKLV